MTDIVERLSGLYDEWNSPHSSPDGLPTGASIMLDAADEITRLRAENESLKTAIQRQANAVRTLEYCKKAEINILRQTHQQAHVAAMTLDSEKNANAILTEENERLRAALLPFASVEADNGDGFSGLPDMVIIRIEASVRELKAARAALEGTKHE